VSGREEERREQGRRGGFRGKGFRGTDWKRQKRLLMGRIAFPLLRTAGGK